jgi:hypothetical protein
MWKDELPLPGSALGVLMALLLSFVFALTFLLEYSPERLLWQAFLVALIIDEFRPFLAKFGGVVIPGLSAVAHFTPRILVLAVMSIWAFNRVPELISTAMSHSGWALAFDIAYYLCLGFLFASALLLTIIGIVFPVWENTFGPTLPRTRDPG